MYPFVVVVEKASEYPQKNHWNMTMAFAAATAHISDRADFRRARPE